MPPSAAEVYNPFHHHRVKRFREKTGLANLSVQTSVIYGGVAFFVIMFVIMNMMVISRLHQTDNNNAGGRSVMVEGEPVDSAGGNNNVMASTALEPQCHFRQYPPRRYYGLQKMEQPDFLTTVDYIYGEYPIIITPSTHIDLVDYHSLGKLCVDQSEWLVPKGTELPFADGTNPSILSLDRLTKAYPDLVAKLKAMGGAFISTICMTNSQCQYQDTPEEIVQFRLSTQEKPTVVHTLLLVLDRQFRTLLQTTVLLERDAAWGRKFKKAQPDANEKSGFVTEAFGLDDSRLFIHLDKLWVSYREGKAFGYEKQVLNEIHMEFNPTATLLNKDAVGGSSKEHNPWGAIIKASESTSFCCGRNMALMEHLEDPTQLQSLTWADPVTVIDVDDGRNKNASNSAKQKRRLA